MVTLFFFFFSEQEYNEDDNSKSIDIENTDDEEDDEPNEYDLIDDIEEEEIHYDDDDEDEEEEYNFDDETDSDEEDSEDDQDSEDYDYEELDEQEEINNECNERNEEIEDEAEKGIEGFEFNVTEEEEQREMTQVISQKRCSINDSSKINQDNLKKLKLDSMKRQEVPVEGECSNPNLVKSNDVFKNRGSPTQLFNAIRFLKTDSNSCSVLKNMGFGSLLDLKINIIPSRLGQHVVQSFDESTMTIKHWRGDIKITKESVEEIFGFPSGGLQINPPERVKSEDACIKNWRKQFSLLEKDTIKVKPKSVVQKLIDAKDRGKLFRINLVVLIATVLFEAMKDGTSNQRILYSISSEYDKINKMDWCGYLIDCLKKCKKDWNPNNKKSYYCGPLTFLTVITLLFLFHLFFFYTYIYLNI